MDFVPGLSLLELELERSAFEADTITEEAGELPGVSAAVVSEIDLSIDSTLEMESRN